MINISDYSDKEAAQKEAARLETLRRYNVLDTDPEDAFDEITRLTAHICQAPISLVCFVDSDRQWFKSHYGLDLSETPRDLSFCSYAIQQPDLMVVPDMRADERFATNPLVIGQEGFRFYAGAPLVTLDGYFLGTLCIIDYSPRQIKPEQRNALTILSRQVVAQLERRSSAKIQVDALADLGYRLSAANTMAEAAGTVVKAAYILSPWDACSLDIYTAETDQVYPVLSMDTIDNRRIPVPHAYAATTPGPMLRKILHEGGQLILRGTASSDSFGSAASTTDGLIPFGDVERPSASLLFVPVRSGLKTVGVLSIQSYTVNAYRAEHLVMLQGLADHCGGAFERITIQATLAKREEEERLAGEKLTALLAVSNELSKSVSIEYLCRRAVELGRSQLGFDRLGIWFLTPEPGTAIGSFGVDETGQVRDESHNLMSTEFASDMKLMLARSKPYLLRQGGPLYNERAEIIGHGFHALAPLWDGEKAIGYISTDNFLNHQPITERDCELLSLYAATLGHLCSRIRTEAELRQEKRFADTVIDSLPGIFYFYDQEGRFLRWNQNFEKVSGYSADAIATMHPLDFFTGPDRDLIAARIQNVFEYGEATAEAAFSSKDGHTTPYFFTGRHITLDGKAYLVGTGIDISERKRLEEQLLQSQKMEGIGRLAGGIAHDFNNLLTAIIGYADMTKEELSESHSEDHPAFTYVQNVCKAADRASALTSQLLAFARKQIIAPRIISLNDLILDTGSILRRLIGEDVELIVSPHPDLWLVKADFNQFGHVLINLAVNARDAMPSGGKLTIETANVTLDADYARRHPDVVPGDYVMLVVSDTGMGIEAAIQQHIFEPFFTTKGVGKGTGLGLATCYGIVKQSGGHIWLYSELDQGTAFNIYLPRVVAEADSSVHTLEAQSVQSGTETILLVEDEKLVLDFAARALRGRGYTVIEASNGPEALRLAQEYTGQINLVVTDVIMPQMNGKVMAEQLRTICPDAHILFASGYTDNSIVTHGVLEAGVAFLQKPYTYTALTRKVREVLDADPLR